MSSEHSVVKLGTAEQLPDQLPPVPYWRLFRYATRWDKLTALAAVVIAALHGALFPVLITTFGTVIDDFGATFLPPNDPNYVHFTDITGSYASTSNLVLAIAIVSLVLGTLQLSLAILAANRIGNRLRMLCFRSLLRQDTHFYDHHETGTLTHLVINDISLIQAGIGDKLPTCVQYTSTFAVGIVVAFVYGWKLTLVILAITPLLIGTGLVFGKLNAAVEGQGNTAYAAATAVATEVLRLVRTVTAYSTQEEEAKRYENTLSRAFRTAVRSALVSGIGLGLAFSIVIASYSLSFWYGSRLVRAGEISAGDVLLVFLSVAIGASSLGTAGPAFKSIPVAQAAAPRVFQIIERKSEIDPLDYDTGCIPEHHITGRLRFHDVDFTYQRDDVEQRKMVLNNFNLEIPEGTSEAFVGKSGCGKSTVARLVMRLYDPTNGRVTLDGVDLREFNVCWLRAQMGIVAQTPSLFKLSIKENIALGAGVEFSVDPKSGKRVVVPRRVTDDQIIDAAKVANAHAFITKLPDGYNTILGERGALLSGGQKQRICIARAIVRNPKILILDESTASLDATSESIVQNALEKASIGRTTITIAHRLSTVRGSDSISCIGNGIVQERGAHAELIRREDGVYRKLMELQNIERQKFERERRELADDADDQEDQIPGHTLANKDSAPFTISKTATDSISQSAHPTRDEDEKPPVDGGLFLRSICLNRREWPLIAIGVFGSILQAVVLPLTSIPLTQVIDVMLRDNSTSGIRKWCIAFLILAAMALVGNFLQFSALHISGEVLTMKLRRLAFRSLLKQEMGYFDLQENSLGSLTQLLSGEATAVKGLTGDLLGITMNILAALCCGLIVSFVTCWRLALIVLAIIPGNILGGYFEVRVSAGIDSGTRKVFSAANGIAVEAVDNISTVRYLGVEDVFVERYQSKINSTLSSKRKSGFVNGVAYGFSEFCKSMIWYATYKAGGKFVEDGYCSYDDMFTSTLALMFSAAMLGGAAAFVPDVVAAKLGATHIYRLIDRESQIDPNSREGEDIRGIGKKVSMKKVYFEYPRRPDCRVLRGLSLDIDNGKTIAVVGPSGHGKSTVISLLQRFYNIRKGSITFDGKDVNQINVQSLRSTMGLVSQEPELFNRSIFDNIAYGAHLGGESVITTNDVEEAAKLANAHEFIQMLPQGYNTLVGTRGDTLSGGQKQRVAIARSLIRKPPLLLLDEATSALDSESEKAVQSALENAIQGRTTVLVAHRLSTIRNADVIAVIRKGVVVEVGNHEALMRKNGAYSKLVEHQISDV
eukprot:TRINITY_DN56_c0_g1_i1.p1 TRINITY_DN56_c0_g1~~TRINITY_DN56_c0_g1_i1.p1  ORF type:complete len:1281 (-),score=235.98 TRINITY_DN56_c0_g1_i1:8334-12176(-)